MSHRTSAGQVGQPWTRRVSNPTVAQWQAAVWVRDLDGHRRLVKARRPTRRAAELALAERLNGRRPLGSFGADPQMTVAQLGEYWMSRRLAESRPPVAGRPRGLDLAAVSPQTLAGYQHALSQIVNPALGPLQLREVRTGALDEVLAGVDRQGRSTRVARSVLSQMFAMAVRHDAIATNPMREVRPVPRRRRDVHALSVEQARTLLELIAAHRDGKARDAYGSPVGGRARTPHLHDLVLLLLATGMRIGEALALQWSDLHLTSAVPSVRVAATLVEPRRDAATGRVFVPGLHRQPMTKTGATRTLALPESTVKMLEERRATRIEPTLPVFAGSDGGWLWPNNQRTKLRTVVRGTSFASVTPHTLRRTVATLVAHEVGLDAARDLLGHRDPSITSRHYVADTGKVIDMRLVIDRFFT